MAVGIRRAILPSHVHAKVVFMREDLAFVVEHCHGSDFTDFVFDDIVDAPSLQESGGIGRELEASTDLLLLLAGNSWFSAKECYLCELFRAFQDGDRVAREGALDCGREP